VSGYYSADCFFERLYSFPPKFTTYVAEGVLLEEWLCVYLFELFWEGCWIFRKNS